MGLGEQRCYYCPLPTCHYISQICNHQWKLYYIQYTVLQNICMFILNIWFICGLTDMSKFTYRGRYYEYTIWCNSPTPLSITTKRVNSQINDIVIAHALQEIFIQLYSPYKAPVLFAQKYNYFSSLIL